MQTSPRLGICESHKTQIHQEVLIKEDVVDGLFPHASSPMLRAKIGKVLQASVKFIRENRHPGPARVNKGVFQTTVPLMHVPVTVDDASFEP